MSICRSFLLSVIFFILVGAFSPKSNSKNSSEQEVFDTGVSVSNLESNVNSNNFRQKNSNRIVSNNELELSNAKAFKLSNSSLNNLHKVYITPTGKKYHKRQCGIGDYSLVLLEDAKSKGLTACRKCFK